MPVAIAGMHRSGTSMVTRLLNLCGLYLGREGDLVLAGPDNPEGFWENAKFQRVNREILTSFGGRWDFPPAGVLENGWESSPHLTTLSNNASLLIKEISQQPVWGWKDPRNSLTLPFWKRLIPNLKTIICLRNPFEVYCSLARRESASSIFSYNLWLIYYRQLITSTKPEERIFTRYDCFFRDPQPELRRLLNFLELEASDETIQAACQTISTRLRHNQGTISDLQATNPSGELLDLYRELCLRAGDHCRSSLSADENAFLENTAAENKPAKTPAKKDAQKIDQEFVLAKEEKSRFQHEIVRLGKENASLQHEIVRLGKENASLQENLDNLLTSRSWRFIQVLQKMKVFFIPTGSKREKSIKTIFRIFKF